MQVIYLLLILGFYLSSVKTQHTENEILFITLSSTGDFTIDSFIEINWEFSSNTINKIALYYENPVNNPNPFYTLNNISTKGNITTNIAFKNITLPTYWQQNSTEEPIKGPVCLNLWIGGLRNEELILSNCLKIQPTWMQDANYAIGDIPIDELFLPGTHDSGAYDKDPEKTNNLGAGKKVIFTQTVDIWSQLVFGNRFFDVRVAAYADDNNKTIYWINHGPFQTILLTDLITALKTFLEKSPDEIIVVAFHEMPVGFVDEESYVKLAEYLEATFDNLMIPRSMQTLPHGPTPNKIWQQKQRLIVCYTDSQIAQNSKYFWDDVNRGGIVQKNNMERNVVYPNPPPNDNPLWGGPLELTADAVYSVLCIVSPKASYGILAQDSNKRITDIYRKYLCLYANVVATEFFLGNDVINIAIECNYLKASLNKLSLVSYVD